MDKDTNKNIKDISNDTDIISGVSVMNVSLSIFHSKTNKLITALYMVTDIIDKEEPIRLKLRTLGVEIISDMNSSQIKVKVKINEIMSFLEIAYAMSFISQMNYTILKKEFAGLIKSIEEHKDIKPTWLEEFLLQPDLSEKQSIRQTKFYEPTMGTRIGVQKGSTLMKALSDKTQHLSDRNISSHKGQFDLLKKQRRESITKIIKDNNDGATIKDIKIKINAGNPNNPIYSEKTLQRELMSMIKDGVLHKTGEKRWSKYFIKPH